LWHHALNVLSTFLPGCTIPVRLQICICHVADPLPCCLFRMLYWTVPVLVQIRMPDNLYEMVVEVHEQVILPLGTEHTPRNGPTPEANIE
jgi:hypothetical protein